ncbi:MAG: transposase [Saprospiraceae bacterium]|nr:transposase [Saprospiraceae bacterium]
MTYRKNFARCVDWLVFNVALITKYMLPERIVVFDPSYLSKSEKHTPGLDRYWSGCARKAKWGLEIGGFSAVDIVNHTALHPVAEQTLPARVEKSGSLLAYYGDLVCEKAILRYPYLGPRKSGRGRPTTFAGKVNVGQLDEQYFTPCALSDDDTAKAFEAKVYVNAWKQWAKVVVAHYYDDKQKLKSVKMYACSLTTVSGAEVWLYYQSRFQSEFLFRDAKQHTGLEHCQSRQQKSLHFHFNLSLSAVSIAKVLHWFRLPADQRGPFSMTDIKTQYFNELLLERFFAAYGIEPHNAKNIPAYKTLFDFGKIAA